MNKKLLDVVILAGGLGTRLRPLTNAMPKSMIPVNGEPFIAHQLRLLKKQGVERVVLCIGHLGYMLQDFVGQGEKFQLNVDYSLDGDFLLGTAGAIRKATLYLPDHFFVLYGDSYLPCDFFAAQQAFLRSGKKALMTLFHNQNAWDKSNIEFDGEKIIAYDKKNPTPDMHYIDYGLGIFHKTVFAELASAAFCDLETIYQRMLTQQVLAAHEVKERFYEIGSFTGLAELEKKLSCNSSEIF